MYTPLSPRAEFNRTPQFANTFTDRVNNYGGGLYDPTTNLSRSENLFKRKNQYDGDENERSDGVQENMLTGTPTFTMPLPVKKTKTPRTSNEGIRTGFHGDVNLTPFNPVARRSSGGVSRRLSSSSSSSHSSSSNSSSGRVFLAISEFRNRQQVGVAAMDIDNPAVFLTQFADDNMYSNTLAMVNFYEPVETLISDTLIDSALFKSLVSEFPNLKVTRVKRKFFNEKLGIELLDSLCIPQDMASCQLDEEKYLCLSSAGCLLKYISNDQKVFTFAPNSVSVQYTSSHTTMQIDISTTKALELVSRVKNLGTTSATTKDSKQKLTLFDLLNHTKTRGGHRLQRMSILQPPIDDHLIKMRQNTVTELCSNDTLYQQLTQLLPLFNDINTVCSSFSHIPLKSTVHITAHQITSILLLRQVLQIIPTLQSICSSVKARPSSRLGNFTSYQQSQQQQHGDIVRLTSHEENDIMLEQTPQSRSFIDVDPDNTLFPSLARNLGGDTAPSMIALIDDSVTVNNAVVQKGIEQSRIQVIYALKQGVNGLLDVARDTFARAVEDINLLAQQIFERYNITGGKVVYTNARGYHLSLPAVSLPKTSHVDVFIRRVYTGTRVACTVLQLESLNIRQTDSYEEVCELSGKHQEGLMKVIRSQLPWLNSLAEAVALVDQLHSFATHVRENPGYVRPVVDYNAPITLRDCKHPQQEKTSCNTIANDVFLNDFSNGLLISGPNNSGKSTYLKQIALIVIMAQIGCFIPASQGFLRVIKHLHVSTRDNDAHHISTNTTGVHGSTSTFFSDMRRLGGVLGRYVSNPAEKNKEQDSKHALILLDEPGRNTSSEDGVAIAWAVVEAQVNARCFVCTVTHFVELLELPDLYPNIRSFAQEVAWDEFSIQPGASEATPSLTFEYKARHAHQAKILESYGIVQAQAVGMPTKIISNAKELVTRLKNIEKQVINTKTMVSLRTNAMYTQLGKLQQQQKQQIQSIGDVKILLKEMVKEFADEIQQSSANNGGNVNVVVSGGGGGSNTTSNSNSESSTSNKNANSTNILPPVKTQADTMD